SGGGHEAMILVEGPDGGNVVGRGFYVGIPGWEMAEFAYNENEIHFHLSPLRPVTQHAAKTD
ncbi:MAG TPA: hypothetical protein VH724_06025, partial [Candidatus Angelobacter sp.]|nr:hypothetical protein [Candidatus Angelobacter sp.]